MHTLCSSRWGKIRTGPVDPPTPFWGDRSAQGSVYWKNRLVKLTMKTDTSCPDSSNTEGYMFLINIIY